MGAVSPASALFTQRALKAAGRRPQAVACQHAPMQAAQFIHGDGLHASADRPGYAGGHGVADHGQCLALRMRHHRVDGLLDHVATGQADQARPPGWAAGFQTAPRAGSSA